MKRVTLVLALAVGLIVTAGQAWGATEDSITATVSLESVVSVSITPDTWAIGAIGLGGDVHQLTNIDVHNDGTEMIMVSLRATDGANGWALGSTPGPDTFRVTWDPIIENLVLTTADQEWIPIPGGASELGEVLQYETPMENTQPSGVDHGFTVTFTAAVYTPP